MSGTHARGLLVDWYGVLTGPHGEDMHRLCARVRATGVPVGVVSNVGGFGGAAGERLAASFDVLVASGEVGISKPSPGILEEAARRLGVPVEGCVFVDDGAANAAAAERLGMEGVHHTDWTATRARVVHAFGLSDAL